MLAGFQKVPEFRTPDNVSGVTLYTSGSILSGSENYYLPDNDPDDDAPDLYIRCFYHNVRCWKRIFINTGQDTVTRIVK